MGGRGKLIQPDAVMPHGFPRRSRAGGRHRMLLVAMLRSSRCDLFRASSAVEWDGSKDLQKVCQ